VVDLVDRMAEQGTAVCPAHPNKYDFFAAVHGPETATEILGRLRWMADRGVQLLPGTDAGLSRFGDSTEALVRLAEWGFAADELLDQATVGAAETLHIPDVGRLAVGARADLLVVADDPRRDITALRRLELVVAGGRPVPSVSPGDDPR
jgi:imidazolonepropionase-like amidohydrolase